MIYKQFQDMPLSALGYGCMRFPTVDGDVAAVNEEEAAKLIARAMEGGDEEDTMTQERFDQLMDNYLTRLGQLPPSGWSAPARAWAEEQGITTGDGDGAFRYRAFPTREETVQMLYQLSQK